jgi:hypothetical protein
MLGYTIRRAEGAPQFFYRLDGHEVLGPVFSDQLFEMYKAGRLTSNAQICPTGEDNWINLNSAIESRRDLPEFTVYRARFIIRAIALWLGLAALLVVALAVARILSGL